MEETRRNYAGPTLERERIDSLDTLRGFALLGILVMNIQSFSMPSSAYMMPNAYGSLEGLNGLVWLVGYLFFDLKFMAMFSMMFGAGIVLMSQHRETAEKPVLRLHYRRMILLLVFGMVHAYAIWYGDILAPYAICGMWVVWLRRWPARRLCICGAVLIVVGSLFHAVAGLGALLSDDVANQMNYEYGAYAEMNEYELEVYRGPWTGQLSQRIEEAMYFQFFVFPAMYFWRISGLMLLGMALFKWRVLDASRSVRFYARLAASGAVLGVSLVGFGAYRDIRNDFEPAHVLGFGALPNWYGSIGVALMWIALVMLACHASALARPRSVLSAYGRMAFTNYIGQSVLATWICYGHGLGLIGHLSRVEQIGVVVAIWAVQLAFSVIWLRYFLFGPLEWLWRSATYKSRQPLRRRGVHVKQSELTHSTE